MLDAAPVVRGLGRLRLNLPGGRMVEMTRDGFERHGGGNVTWRGRVAGDDASRVILTVKDGYMAGRIYRGLDEFEIRPGAGYNHVIERVDTSIVPLDEHVEPPVAYSDGIDLQIPSDPFMPSPTDSPDNIQLMVAYTSQARAAAGGTPQMEVRIQSMIDLANTAFIDSDMVARYVLARTEEVAYPESGDVTTDLIWAATDFGVDMLRDLVGADMVSLIVENQGRCAGAAFVMTTPDYQSHWYAYQVTALNCGGGTFVHEHGHNMGFEHNPEDSPRSPENQVYDPYMPPPAEPSYPWSFGHYVDGSFRTIMSYPTRCLLDCPAALRFSNPDITFLGSPTGILDERDNAQTGDLTAPIVAAFRDSINGAAVINRRVAASVEDVEELVGGSVVLNSTTLELGDGLSGVQAIGLRFQNMNIPLGMRIDSAYLEFEAAGIGSTAAVVEIRAEATDNAQPFTGAAFDVTGRATTLASVTWDLPAWDTVTEKHYSPDISAVIQEVVSTGGWIENNSLVLIVSGTGIREALSHDGGAGASPLLHVAYSSPDSPTLNVLEVSFSYSCTSLTCTFTDQTTSKDGPITWWSWYFDYPVSVSSAEQSPTVTFPAAGTYNVSLEVRDGVDGMGRTSQSFTITETGANIAPVATANFYHTKNDATLTGNLLTDGTPDSDFDGDPLTVTGTDYGPYLGTLSMAANGDFIYTPNAGITAGDDEFTYTISDGKGGTATATVSIEVTTDLVADFRYSCTDATCSFADASTHATGQIVSWSWYFYTDPFFPPDMSIERNPTYTFPNSGTYGVVLVVTDEKGVSASVSKDITVNIDNYPPVAAFSQSCTDLSCTFTDGSTDVEGPISAWSWSFGDGATATVQNPTHSYTTAGTYMVTLTVTDAAGATDTTSQTTTVNTPPVAAFSYGCVDWNCSFTDGSTDTGGITSWSWSFGDGATSTAQNPTHIYAADGIYTVTLAVTDAAGATDTASQAITVANTPPVAGFNVGCAGLNCGFTDGSTDAVGVTSWSWSFGDGAVSTAQSPAHGYTADGVYTVALTVTDTAGATDTASQTITVANTAPIATDNAYTTDEDVTLTGNMMTDGIPDSDPDGDVLTIAGNTDPLNGTVTVYVEGTFVYRPAPDFNGVDSFNYTIGDGKGGTATATVTITVNPVPDFPYATDNAYTTDEDIAVSGNVMTDGVPDSDGDGDPLTARLSTAPLNGIATVALNGDFTYTPSSNFNGTDSFIYWITDGHGDRSYDTATVTITVNPVNDAPVATDNAYTTDEDIAVSGNVLTDGVPDSDIDGDVLTVTANTGPLNGTVTVAATGAFTYTPNSDFNGSDSFTYTISDGSGGSDVATVTITINSVNNPPDVAFSHSCPGLICTFTDYSSDSRDPEGRIVSWLWSFGDGTTSTVQNPEHQYPASGTYDISLTVTDNEGATGTLATYITVTNLAPEATDNYYSTDEEVSVSGNVLTDGIPDSDPEGHTLTVTANTDPRHGVVTVAANGDFTYTPNADYPDSNFYDPELFHYTISDGHGGTATATVAITVTPVNDAPVASFTFSCTDLDCGFTDGSTDIDGTIAARSWDFGDGAISVVQSPTHGYVAVDATYTVTLTVTDDLGASDTTTRSVTVVNPFPPTAPSGLVGASTFSGNGANAVIAVTLSWTDNAINEEVFVIERCEIQGKRDKATCTFLPVAEVGVDAAGYAETVPGNTSYRYRVKARNRNGDSGYSNEAEIPKSLT